MSYFGKGGYVYIMSNYGRTVLYIGVTSNLAGRIYMHRYQPDSIFVKKYKCKYLIFYEKFDSIEEAITRERRLKHWNRKWKDELISKFNPGLRDLYEDIQDFD